MMYSCFYGINEEKKSNFCYECIILFSDGIELKMCYVLCVL